MVPTDIIVRHVALIAIRWDCERAILWQATAILGPTTRWFGWTGRVSGAW